MSASPVSTPPAMLPTPEESLDLSALRRRRRHPRRTQCDYLHLRSLRDDVATALAEVGPVEDVLDVFCGTRPYEDLLPPGSRTTALDIEDWYGVADVVTDEFLPFEDNSFDLVVCYQAFYYHQDPMDGVSEIARVLRPGGHVIVSVPFAWEYDASASAIEHRYTGPEIAALFDGWDCVKTVENGGKAVTWASLTGRLIQAVERASPQAARRIFPAVYVALNGWGALLDRAERRYALSSTSLPTNVLLSARRPV
jgi:SAM-dependent methyltransferase